MKQKRWILFFILLTSLFSFSVNTFADSEYVDPLWDKNSQSRVAAIENETYKKACGRCHEVYSPALLPPQSWEKIMTSLDSHFGKQLAFDKKTQQALFRYLLNNAAGRAKYALSSRLIQDLDNPVPLRITELPYFLQKHKNMTVKPGNCSVCHSKALQGSFDKSEVKIPLPE